jgi:tetratricopeptide (TPR) repeat protein
MKTTAFTATITAAQPSFTYYCLGKDLLESNQRVAAAQALDEAIRRGQCLADAYYLRGKLNFDNGEMTQAAADFRKALHNQTTKAADCKFLLDHLANRRRREDYFRAFSRTNSRTKRSNAVTA